MGKSQALSDVEMVWMGIRGSGGQRAGCMLHRQSGSRGGMGSGQLQTLGEEAPIQGAGLQAGQGSPVSEQPAKDKAEPHH